MIFDGPFVKFGIKMVGTQTLPYNGKKHTTEYIRGCSLKMYKSEEVVEEIVEVKYM